MATLWEQAKGEFREMDYYIKRQGISPCKYNEYKTDTTLVKLVTNRVTTLLLLFYFLPHCCHLVETLLRYHTTKIVTNLLQLLLPLCYHNNEPIFPNFTTLLHIFVITIAFDQPRVGSLLNKTK